jgi:VanZ family protein
MPKNLVTAGSGDIGSNATQHGSNRNRARILLVLCIVGIVYLSLYPFTFTATAKASGIGWRGPRLDSDWVDMFVNFVAYLPLGFLATVTRRRRNWASVLAATALGATLSLAMESAQMYLPTRDSNFRDLLFDAVGTLAGSLGAVAVRRFQARLAVPWPAPIACGLMLLWAGWQLFPFIPLLKRYKLRELAVQLSAWNFSAAEFGDVGSAAFVLYAFGASGWITAAVLAVTLLGQSVVMGLTYSNARIAAAAAGLAVAILLGRPRRRAGWIALAAVLGAWALFRLLGPRSLSARDLAGQAFLGCAVVASLYRAFLSTAKETLPVVPGGRNVRL